VGELDNAVLTGRSLYPAVEDGAGAGSYAPVDPHAMAARVLTEQRLIGATLDILINWAEANGRTILWKSESEMVNVTRQGNEFWINQEAKASKNADKFYSELTHELVSDSMGYRGIMRPNRYIQMPNGMTFSDRTLLPSAIERGDVESVVRSFANE
jgi:hypothetical protein